MANNNIYDRVDTFTPEGTVKPLEYIKKSVELGNTTIALGNKNCAVLLAYTGKSSALNFKQPKIFKISKNAIFSFSGITNDGFDIVQYLIDSSVWEEVYKGRDFNPLTVFNGLSTEASIRTIYSRNRMFGCGGILLCKYKEEIKIMEFEPTGNTQYVKGVAIGSRSQSSRTILEKYVESFDSASKEELIKIGMEALKNAHTDEDLTEENVEMQNSLYTSKIKKLLGRPKGIKVALFDKRSYEIISSCAPHTLFLQNDYFLLSMIEDNDRTKMSDVTCAAFISKKGLSYLFNELLNPFYGSYHLFLLNSVSDICLTELAKVDNHNVVIEVIEIYVDMYQQDEDLFTLENKVTEIDTANQLERIVSLMNTLEICPSLVAPLKLKDFKDELSFLLKKNNQNNRGNLLIVDRSDDYITPLIYNWYYQSMLYDYTDYSLGIVKLRKVIYQVFNDKIFQKTRFCDLSNLKSKILDLKDLKTKSIDFNSFFKTDFYENKNTFIETNLILHNTITLSAIENAFLSDLEFSLLADRNYFKNNHAKLVLVLKDSKIPEHKRLKLFFISVLCLLDPETKKELIISHWFVKKFPELLSKLFRFLEIYKPKKIKESIFQKEKDYKLGYNPLILKTIKEFYNNGLKGYCIDKEIKKDDQLIVYFKGGVTFYEYQVIKNQYPKAVVLGDWIIGYKNIVDESDG